MLFMVQKNFQAWIKIKIYLSALIGLLCVSMKAILSQTDIISVHVPILIGTKKTP